MLNEIGTLQGDDTIFIVGKITHIKYNTSGQTFLFDHNK